MAAQQPKNILDPNELRKYLRILRRNWLILVLLPALAYGFSVVYTYKMTSIYAATTQILLKSNETYDYQQQIFKGLGYYQTYQDVANQKRIITSNNLIDSTLARLNLDVSYYIIGRIKKQEVYAYTPFLIDVNSFSKEYFEREIGLRITSENKFQLSYKNAAGEDISREGTFDVPLKDDGLNVLIKKTAKISKKSIPVISQIQYAFVVHNPVYLRSKFKSSISVENIEYTNILLIKVEDQLPERAVRFLDSLSYVYLRTTMQSQIDINENTIRYIDQQLDTVVHVIDSIENEMDTLRIDRDIINLGKEEDQFFAQYVDMESKKQIYNLKIKSFTALENYINNSKDAKFIPPTYYVLNDEGFLQTSMDELYSMQITRNNALVNVKEPNPSITQLNVNIERMKKDILLYIANSRGAVKIQINDVDREIQRYEGLLKKLPKTQREMLAIQRKLDVNEKLYTFLLEKRANTVIARAGIIPATRIIESAHSVGVVKPDKNKIRYTFGGVAFAIALLIVFIRIQYFTKIETLSELKEQTTLPVLGEIPIHHTNESKKKSKKQKVTAKRVLAISQKQKKH